MTDVKVLTSPYQRGTGAMFTSGLGETVLVFAYPSSFNRVFTTWFCPPLLRILCFDDNGVLSYDRVVRSWRLISLPKTRLVLEVDPDLLCDSIIEDIARLGVELMDWTICFIPRVSKRGRNAGGRSVWQIDLRPCSQCLDGIERRQEFWQEHPSAAQKNAGMAPRTNPQHRVLYCRYPGNRALRHSQFGAGIIHEPAAGGFGSRRTGGNSGGSPCRVAV